MDLIWDVLAAHWTEILGFGTGLVCVLLAGTRNVWNFPIGIANNLVFIVLFWGAQLYADLGLQFVYIAMGVMGWRLWSQNRGADQRLIPTHTPRRAIFPLVFGGAALAAVLAWLLHSFTDSPTVWADATTTAASLVAQFMLNKKWIETWWVWIAVDVAFVGLFVFKELYLTAVLYALFILVCANALRLWRAHLPVPVAVPREASALV